jgi:hypothetical protein
MSKTKIAFKSTKLDQRKLQMTELDVLGHIQGTKIQQSSLKYNQNKLQIRYLNLTHTKYKLELRSI